MALRCWPNTGRIEKAFTDKKGSCRRSSAGGRETWNSILDMLR